MGYSRPLPQEGDVLDGGAQLGVVDVAVGLSGRNTRTAAARKHAHASNKPSTTWLKPLGRTDAPAGLPRTARKPWPQPHTAPVTVVSHDVV
jgi:hypothetical protein